MFPLLFIFRLYLSMLVLTSTDKLLTTMLKIVDIFCIHILLHNFFNTTPMKFILQNIISKMLLLAGRASTREPKVHIWVNYVGFILWYRVTFLSMLSFVKYSVVINHDSMRVICIFIITIILWKPNAPKFSNQAKGQLAFISQYFLKANGKLCNIFENHNNNITFSPLQGLYKMMTMSLSYNNEVTSPCLFP